MPVLSAAETGNLSDFLHPLVEHLTERSLRTDGPFTLRSGRTSSWYLDARQTTYDGVGAGIVGSAVLELLSDDVVAVGGMTMGADPVSIATALIAAQGGRPMVAFSIRKETKDHGTGGRLVGPVRSGDVVAALDDTVTTGGALIESIEVMRESGLNVVQAVALVDRSNGEAGRRCTDLGVPFTAIVLPDDLGVEGP